MSEKAYLIKVECPECGLVQLSIIRDGYDGFYCKNENLEVRRGTRTWQEDCGFNVEKIYHLPSKNHKYLKEIKIVNDSLEIVDVDNESDI